TGKFLLLKSFSPDKEGKDFTHAGNLLYSSRKWTLGWQHEYVGKNYNAEVGYVPRTAYIKLNPVVNYLFFPKGTKILSHGPQFTSTYYFDENFKETDDETILSYKFNFRNQSVFSFGVAHTYIKLLQPFDPTNSGMDSLATGSEHHWNYFGIDYVSKPQSVFTYLAALRYGGYYEGGIK